MADETNVEVRRGGARKMWVVQRDMETLKNMPRQTPEAPGPDGDVVPWAMAQHIGFAGAVPAMPEILGTFDGELLLRGELLLESIRLAGLEGPVTCMYRTQRPAQEPPGAVQDPADGPASQAPVSQVTVSFTEPLDPLQERALAEMWTSAPSQHTDRTWGWAQLDGGAAHKGPDAYPSRAFLEAVREFSHDEARVTAVCGRRLHRA